MRRLDPRSPGPGPGETPCHWRGWRWAPGRSWWGSWSARWEGSRTGGPGGHGGPSHNPFLSNPTTGHPYRHGAVPLPLLGGSHQHDQQNRVMGSTHRDPRPPRGRVMRAALEFRRRNRGHGVAQGLPGFRGSRWGSPEHRSRAATRSIRVTLTAWPRTSKPSSTGWAPTTSVERHRCPVLPRSPVRNEDLPAGALDEPRRLPERTVLAGVWEDTSSAVAAATGNADCPRSSQRRCPFLESSGRGIYHRLTHWHRSRSVARPRNGYCAYHDSTGDPFSG